MGRRTTAMRAASPGRVLCSLFAAPLRLPVLLASSALFRRCPAHCEQHRVWPSSSSTAVRRASSVALIGSVCAASASQPSYRVAAHFLAAHHGPLRFRPCQRPGWPPRPQGTAAPRMSTLKCEWRPAGAAARPPPSPPCRGYPAAHPSPHPSASSRARSKNDPVLAEKRRQAAAELDAAVKKMTESNPGRVPAWERQRVMQVGTWQAGWGPGQWSSKVGLLLPTMKIY